MRAPTKDGVLGECDRLTYAQANARITSIAEALLARGFNQQTPLMILSGNSIEHALMTYGASKLAGEALIAAYVHMFGMSGLCFRFANVVGPRQTHGVGYDFVRRLMLDPSRLAILGDGTQTKSYKIGRAHV